VVVPLLALLMWLGARATPAWRVEVPAGDVVAWLLVAVAAAVGVAGLVAFRRARTTVNPLAPQRATALVVSGIYRYSRNPMYLALALGLLAWSLFLTHALAPLGVVAFVAWMNLRQIPPEERALAVIFGEDFERYRSEVRRWI
jgi:protein-S-isoprenylcysteine O-methyltransferase Ste14